MGNLSEARKQAWATRRAKYGDRGHASSYSRTATPCPACQGAVALLIRLLHEGSLSEGQVARATQLDRISIRRMGEEHAERSSPSPGVPASVCGRGTL
jgi:hypothetical protein